MDPRSILFVFNKVSRAWDANKCADLVIVTQDAISQLLGSDECREVHHLFVRNLATNMGEDFHYEPENVDVEETRRLLFRAIHNRLPKRHEKTAEPELDARNFHLAALNELIRQFTQQLRDNEQLHRKMVDEMIERHRIEQEQANKRFADAEAKLNRLEEENARLQGQLTPNYSRSCAASRQGASITTNKRLTIRSKRTSDKR